MYAKKVITHVPAETSYSFYTTEQIKALSVKEITCPESFDSFQNPCENGMYDPALGVDERDDLCATCGQTTSLCPGHLGHIVLPFPAFNPLMFQHLLKLLRGSCLFCHQVMAPVLEQELFIFKMKLLEAGCIIECEKIYQMEKDFAENQCSENIVIEKLREFTEETIKRRQGQIQSLSRNVFATMLDLVKGFFSKYFSTNAKCPFCSSSQLILKNYYNRNIHYKRRSRGHSNWDEFSENEVFKIKESEGFLDNDGIYKHLKLVWENNLQFLEYLYGTALTKGGGMCKPRPEMFFIEVLPVPPVKFRPCTFMHGKKYEGSQSHSLNGIIKDIHFLKVVKVLEDEKLLAALTNEQCSRMKRDVAAIFGTNLKEKFFFILNRIQSRVNAYFDSGLEKANDFGEGIKQIIEKKEGLFRMNVMGKRVNYCARSVISPDPNLHTTEVGLPGCFATKLTFPQPVTSWNLGTVKRAVLNGPFKYPGATHVVMPDGASIRLNRKSQRISIANQLFKKFGNDVNAIPKIVYRHIQNGDWMVLNRQPSLHKPSMQGFRVRIIPGERTLRIHYSNCKAFNADFDGDEINAHFTQSETSKCEIMSLMATSRMYLVPKDGSPLGGLIHDHVVSAVTLTARDRFLTKHEAEELLVVALPFVRYKIKLVEPAIYKPRKLWTGKQIISSIILNISFTESCVVRGHLLNYEGKTKLGDEVWQKEESRMESDPGLSDAVVTVREGHFLQGVLDKAQIGSTLFSLVHGIYEVLGHHCAADFLSALSKLFTCFLQRYRGFSLGVQDIICTPSANLQRVKFMMECRKIGTSVARQTLGIPEDELDSAVAPRLRSAHLKRDDFERKMWDNTMKQNVGEHNTAIISACVPDGLLRRLPYNNLQLMICSGAKGSSANSHQISCLLGQIELEGRRPPLQISGKSLPSFLQYDASPKSGGYVDGRFLTGIEPQEYFFHCMAGREGLIDTAVKTSRSGYLQRCCIKLLESCVVDYNHSVRDTQDDRIIQFLYGEDGLDTTKASYLKPSQYTFLRSNAEALTNEIKMAKNRLTNPSLKDYKVNLQNSLATRAFRKSPFLSFAQCYSKLATKFTDLSEFTSYRSKIISRYFELSPEERVQENDCLLDPALSLFRPGNTFGCVTESLDDAIKNFVSTAQIPWLPQEQQEKYNKRLRKQNKSFADLMYYKALTSLVDPGEGVGLIAAQSIGEPSTQMTLNTFHFAGRGEMNVTLGIPRLKEIIQVGNKEIKTPFMEVPIIDKEDTKQDIEDLQRQFKKVVLADVLSNINVCDSVKLSTDQNSFSAFKRVFEVKLAFLSAKYYKDSCVNPGRILNFIEKQFIKYILKVYSQKIDSSRITSRTLAEGVDEEGNVMSRGRHRNVADDTSDVEAEPESLGLLAERQLDRAFDERDYEDEIDEEDAAIIFSNDDDNGSDNEDNVSEINEENDDEDHDESLTEPTTTPKKVKKGISSAAKMRRVSAVLSLSNVITAYDFDTEKQGHCSFTLEFDSGNMSVDLTSLIQTESKRAVIHQIKGLERAVITHDNIFKTEGINFNKLLLHGRILDLSKFYSNNIALLCERLGVEAAYSAIIREITSVFAVYGIEVNKRHLSLIADYMTHGGTYRAFNRFEMANNSSHIQRMTFESSIMALKTAVTAGTTDSGTSVSSTITLGQLSKVGTGAFDVLPQLVYC